MVSDELFVRRHIMDKDAVEISIEGTRFLSEKKLEKAIKKVKKRYFKINETCCDNS